jgi:hypothetical protein
MYWLQRRGGVSGVELNHVVDKAHSLPESKALPSRNGTMEKALPLGGSPWVSFGPTPIVAGTSTFAGRVSTLAIDPVAPSTIYAGAANGGVWKSVNSGDSWTPMSNETNQPTLAMGSVAVDPTNHNVIYAGTGEHNPAADARIGRGVLKSSDAGASWTLLSQGPCTTTTINRMLVGPTGTVWVACPTGLSRSTNGGATWTSIFTIPVSDVAMSTDGMLLLAVLPSVGVYRSQDGGVNWVQVFTGQIQSTRLAIARSNADVVYAALDLTTTISTFVSTDRGTSWRATSSNTYAGNTSGGFEIAVDPLNFDLVYVGGESLTYNASGTVPGSGWRPVPDSGHPNQHAIVFPPCAKSPCPLYLGNDGGVFYLPGGMAAGATSRNTNLTLAQFVGGDLGWDFQADTHAIGGTQGTGTLLFIRNNPPTPNSPLGWRQTLGGNGGFAYLGQQQNNTSLAYTEESNPSGSLQCNSAQCTGPWKTENWGYDWPTLLSSGLLGLSAPLYPFYTIDRSDDQHLAFGAGNGVYELMASQSSWFKSNDQPLSTAPSSIAIAPCASSVIYAGLPGGTVYRATGAYSGVASQYKPRSGGLPSGNNYVSINSLAVDCTDPAGYDAAFLAGAAHNSTTPQVVFKTVDGGVNWVNISGNLPVGLPAYSIVTYRAGATRVLVIGTEAGVFFSTNDGQTWIQFNDGLPNVAVTQLALDHNQTAVAAFTYGRGAFSTNIGCTYSIAPASQSFGSSAGNGSIAVSTSAGCPWSAASNASWITVTGGASGSGNGTVTYSVAGNTGTSSRTGTLTVAGQTFTVSQSGTTTVPDGTGLYGQYFNNPNLTGPPALTRIDGPIDFSWVSRSPGPGIGIDSFSIRWTGKVLPQYSETYTFYVFSDDGVRLWINGQLLLDRWFNQYGPEVASAPITLQAGQKYDIRIEYYEAYAGAEIHLSWSSPSTPKQIVPASRLFPVAPQGNGIGLTGNYFNNTTLTGPPALTRIDGPLDLAWVSGSPGPGIGIDNFSVRWTGKLQSQYSETFTFYVFSDDGVRLWVNGQLLLDRWFDQYGPEVASLPISLTAGQSYDIRVEYYEHLGGAEIHLSWSSSSVPKQIVPVTQLYPN